jgi:hypothetical protein
MNSMGNLNGRRKLYSTHQCYFLVRFEIELDRFYQMIQVDFDVDKHVKYLYAACDVDWHLN